MNQKLNSSAIIPGFISSAIFGTAIKHSVIFKIFWAHKVIGFIQSLSWKANGVWIATTSRTILMHIKPQLMEKKEVSVDSVSKYTFVPLTFAAFFITILPLTYSCHERRRGTLPRATRACPARPGPGPSSPWRRMWGRPPESCPSSPPKASGCYCPPASPPTSRPAWRRRG